MKHGEQGKEFHFVSFPSIEYVVRWNLSIKAASFHGNPWWWWKSNVNVFFCFFVIGFTALWAHSLHELHGRLMISKSSAYCFSKIVFLARLVVCHKFHVDVNGVPTGFVVFFWTSRHWFQLQGCCHSKQLGSRTVNLAFSCILHIGISDSCEEAMMSFMNFIWTWPI